MQSHNSPRKFLGVVKSTTKDKISIEFEGGRVEFRRMPGPVFSEGDTVIVDLSDGNITIRSAPPSTDEQPIFMSITNPFIDIEELRAEVSDGNGSQQTDSVNSLPFATSSSDIVVYVDVEPGANVLSSGTGRILFASENNAGIIANSDCYSIHDQFSNHYSMCQFEFSSNGNKVSIGYAGRFHAEIFYGSLTYDHPILTTYNNVVKNAIRKSEEINRRTFMDLVYDAFGNDIISEEANFIISCGFNNMPLMLTRIPVKINIYGDIKDFVNILHPYLDMVELVDDIYNITGNTEIISLEAVLTPSVSGEAISIPASNCIESNISGVVKLGDIELDVLRANIDTISGTIDISRSKQMSIGNVSIRNAKINLSNIEVSTNGAIRFSPSDCGNGDLSLNIDGLFHVESNEAIISANTSVTIASGTKSVISGGGRKFVVDSAGTHTEV